MIIGTVPIFSTATNYTFAGQNISISLPLVSNRIFIVIFDETYVPDNSVKYNIEVKSWPFTNMRNQLRIVLANEASSGNPSACQSSQSNIIDGTSNLQ